MNGLMNGKPYHGIKRAGAPYVSQKFLIDYQSMAEIVKDGIKKGLVIPAPSLIDIAVVKKDLNTSKRTYGTAQCILCLKKYSKQSSNSTVCTPCKSVKVSCPICSKMFVPYRKGTKHVSSCSTICGVELMKKTKRNKVKNEG